MQNLVARRPVLFSLLGLTSLAHAQTGTPEDAFAQRLRAGACALAFRHARTVPGVGDPDGFRVDLCSTQRNLSEEGRAQAKAAGQWFTAQKLRPRAVFSSAWCRCRDTADLAFGRHVMWSPLNSFFGQPESHGPQTSALKTALAKIPVGQFDVWVTHQVNLTALTGESLAMGEALLIDAQGKIVARRTFT